MIGRLRCWLGWHAWSEYWHSTPDVQVCMRCGRLEFQP